MLNLDKFKEASNVVAETNDQSQEQSFTIELPDEGPTTARLVSYIEYGKHFNEFEGKVKDKADTMVMLKFELIAEKHKKVVKVDGEEKVMYPTITERIPMSFTAKSGFFKLFHKMDYGRGLKHMSQMLGDIFVIDVKHTVGKKDPKKKYVFLKHKGEWQISAPSYTDPMTGQTTQFTCDQPTLPYQALLWDNPDMEQWQSIFIDGTRKRTRKIDGKDVEVEESKNFLQQLCLEAENFSGSPLEAVLADVDLTSMLPVKSAAEASTAPQTMESAPMTMEENTPPAMTNEEAMAALGNSPTGAAEAATTSATSQETSTAQQPTGDAPVDPALALLQSVQPQ